MNCTPSANVGCCNLSTTALANTWKTEVAARSCLYVYICNTICCIRSALPHSLPDLITETGLLGITAYTALTHHLHSTSTDANPDTHTDTDTATGPLPPTLLLPLCAFTVSFWIFRITSAETWFFWIPRISCRKSTRRDLVRSASSRVNAS